MAFSGLRNCQRPKEILQGLIKLSFSEGPGYLWQNLGGERRLWPVRVRNFDVNQKVLEVSVDCDLEIPLEDSVMCLDLQEIESNKDLFFKGEEKDILFKTEGGDYLIRDDQVRINIPHRVFFREDREAKRFVPQFPPSLSMKLLREKNDSINLIMECQNISKKGIGAAMLPSQGHFLEKGDCLFLEKVGDNILAPPLSLEIVYKRQTKVEEVSKIQMGLSFDEELTSEMIKEILASIT